MNVRTKRMENRLKNRVSANAVFTSTKQMAVVLPGNEEQMAIASLMESMEIHVTLLGTQNAGKTSLLKKILQNFEPDELEAKEAALMQDEVRHVLKTSNERHKVNLVFVS